MALQTVRGFKDILPPESERATALEATARRVLTSYGFRELRLPTVESHELFVKSTGETTDIVEKEMFVLEDQAGRKLALRPEGTPGAVRAYIQHSLHQQGGRTKLFYAGSMFRAERPQAGRYREFEQIGAECFGNPHPAADAEAILALARLFDEAGLEGRFSIHINNLGDEQAECRPRYRARLKEALEKVKGELCEHCQRRLERNPLRVLDCKGDGPKLREKGILPKLEPCTPCADHFTAVLRFLEAAGRKSSIDAGLVRGLDYYTRTVFEFRSDAVGSQDAIAGGGRYDGLVKGMGGPDSPAVGWAMGVERTLLACASALPLSAAAGPDVYVAAQSQDPRLEEAAMALLDACRRTLSAEGGLFGHSLKAQMREADRLGAKFAVIFGETEFREGKCTVKDMKAKEQNQWQATPAEVPQAILARLRARP